MSYRDAIDTPDSALLAELLARTSRTFAATIPLLEEPLHEQVRAAYLLFRIADTLEDAEQLQRDERLEGLRLFGALLRERPSAQLERFVGWCREHRPTSHRGHAALLEQCPRVFAALAQLSPPAAQAICRHLGATVSRMAEFVARADARAALRLQSLEELRAYCYAVAGIVGELLCTLLLLEAPALRPARLLLERDAIAFGEGLQLVNILKDAQADAQEGRCYIPPALGLAPLFELARADLAQARRYVETLHEHSAVRGTLAFHALPIRLAHATLERLESAGPGSRLSRTEVAEELLAMNAALDAGGSGLT